jgi:hypothetical protein
MDASQKPVPEDEALIAVCAQLLAVSLSDSAELPFEELLERMEKKTEDDEPAGRAWITAVRRAQRAGQLTRDQADALVHIVADSVISGSSKGDPEMAALQHQLRPLVEQHTRNWDAYTARLAERKGARGGARADHGKGVPETPSGDADGEEAKPEAPPGMHELMDRSCRRHELLCQEMLVAVGERDLAMSMRDDGKKFWQRVRRGLSELHDRDDFEDRASRVEYPSWEDDDEPLIAPVAAERATRQEVYDEEYAERLAGFVERWRLAVTGKDIWTVSAALDFTYLASVGNEEGEGDLQIAVIQRARELGVLDKPLSWLLLDRVAEAMLGMSPEDGDPILRQIEDQINEVECDGGGPPDEAEGETAIEATAGASASWVTLDAVRERRLTLLKRRVLRGAGETEMAREMKERPVAFLARLKAAASEWGVEEPGHG